MSHAPSVSAAPTHQSAVGNHTRSHPSVRKHHLPTTSTKRTFAAANNHVKSEANKLPACLQRLVRSVVRTFYSREHSLIVDMLVRNTIMREDDLCARLRFEQNQLQQYLHTLKADQFIKSKMQLETDADGKTTKIVHYFIEYQLFVNIVKYRLDQMQRQLEAEQRQSSSRASFRCAVCNITYTDLEVDRLLSLESPGKLECVYCRGEVNEQEDHSSRTDGRALIANFHRQIRDPIDTMLRECDEIHLSSSLIEPEFRKLEPVTQDPNNPTTSVDGRPLNGPGLDGSSSLKPAPDQTKSTTDSRVRIVIIGQRNSEVAPKTVKQRPVWMADSTILSGGGLGELDRGPNLLTTPQTETTEPVIHTLAPGRIPSSGSKDATDGSNASSNGPLSPGDIMQLLLVHERRGQTSHLSSKVPQSSTAAKTTSSKAPPNTSAPSEVTRSTELANPNQQQHQYVIRVGEQLIPYAQITPTMVKQMTPQEKSEYVRIGKLIYRNVMLL